MFQYYNYAFVKCVYNHVRRQSNMLYNLFWIFTKFYYFSNYEISYDKLFFRFGFDDTVYLLVKFQYAKPSVYLIFNNRNVLVMLHRYLENEIFQFSFSFFSRFVSPPFFFYCNYILLKFVRFKISYIIGALVNQRSSIV